MSHLKQTLHKYYTTIFTTISTIATELQSHGVVRLNLSVSGESWEDAIKPDVALNYSTVDW